MVKIELGLTDAAHSEVKRLAAVFMIKESDVIRHSLSLFRIYERAVSRGGKMEVTDLDGTVKVIELPVQK